MTYPRNHPLLDLGKGLRDRLGADSETPSDRMRELLERMAGIGMPTPGSEGDGDRPGGRGSGA
jgi:hypothetical protein